MSSALATIALTTRMMPGAVKPLSAHEYWPLARRLDPGAMLGSEAATIAHEAGIPRDLSERVVRLLDRATAVALMLEGLEQSGIWTLTSNDDAYPQHLAQRLSDAAPPLLHGVGDSSLFAHPGLGIVGSRDVAPEGVHVAREAATRAATNGWAVVSGAARGVDQHAMSTASQTDGFVIGVLAEALTRVVRRPDMRQAVLAGNVLLVTPYAPDAGFRVANAMGRNKVIYGLSRRVLVVCSDTDTGGTWAGATEALRAKWSDVAAWRGPGEGPGNALLVGRGARELTDLRDLFISTDLPISRRHADQLSLDV